MIWYRWLFQPKKCCAIRKRKCGYLVHHKKCIQCGTLYNVHSCVHLTETASNDDVADVFKCFYIISRPRTSFRWTLPFNRCSHFPISVFHSVMYANAIRKKSDFHLTIAVGHVFIVVEMCDSAINANTQTPNRINYHGFNTQWGNLVLRFTHLTSGIWICYILKWK